MRPFLHVSSYTPEQAELPKDAALKSTRVHDGLIIFENPGQSYIPCTDYRCSRRAFSSYRHFFFKIFSGSRAHVRQEFSSPDII